MRKVRQSVMANRSDRDPPSLNRVRGEKPTEEMRRGSADSIRASGKKAPHAARRPSGKLGLIVARLERTAGATIEELVDATGWQKHSVHGALSRLRSADFAIGLELTAGRKAYRLAPAEG